MTAEERKNQVEYHLKQMLSEGTTPSSREVMRRMGRSDDRSIRKDWDALAVEGRAPVRPRSVNATEKEHGFRPGRTLLSVEDRLSRFQSEFITASDEHKELGREFWLRHLGEIERVLSQTWELITGAGLEQLLQQVSDLQNRKEKEQG